MTDILLTPVATEQELIILNNVFKKELPAEELINKLSVDDFYYDDTKYIYNTIKSMVSRKKEVNSHSVIDYMKERDKKYPFPVNTIEKIFRSYYPYSESFIFIIKEKSAKRKLIQLSGEILEMVNNPENESNHIIDAINHNVSHIDNMKNNDVIVHDFHNVLKKRYYEIEDNKTNNTMPYGLMTGISTIDNMTAGFRLGEYIVIGARPSMGKTALMSNIATNMAENREYPPSLVFSLEMRKESLADRALASMSGTDQNVIKYNNVENYHLMKFANAIDAIDAGRIYVCDKPSMTTGQIKSTIRKYVKDHGIGIVFIDYMARIRYTNPKDDEYNGITQISFDLKECCRELNIPIICLAQLNRNCEGRANNKPIMSDLKGSGAIEADADFIGLLYRPSYYGIEELKKNKYEENDMQASELIIAKNRCGHTGTARMNWIAEYSLFTARER